MEQGEYGAAEQIIRTLVSYSDHVVHNRPGIVTPAPRLPTGVLWAPVTHKTVEGQDIVYSLTKQGRKTVRNKIGIRTENGNIVSENGNPIGRYQSPGIFPEAALWFYKNIADVWRMDNEFAAKWASYAFQQDHRDLKLIMACFFLVQAKKGDPVVDDDNTMLFRDEDYRDVGEAMALLYGKQYKALSPKQLIQIHKVLSLPAIARLNQELGFTIQYRHPTYGRYNKMVRRWLWYRETNPALLEGLLKEGYRTTVIELARLSRYKPVSEKFFEQLRWPQKQSESGHRTLAIGKHYTSLVSWEGLSEEEVCRVIQETKPSYKVLVSLVPKNIGITQAVMACAVESGCLSAKDMIIATPTLEKLGLLEVPEVSKAWTSATKEIQDFRAKNIAKNVEAKKTKEALEGAAEKAVAKVMEEVSRDLRIYVGIDISSSMNNCLDTAKKYISQIVGVFPQDRVHAAVFNTSATVVNFKHWSPQGVTHALNRWSACGGTDYGSAVRALSKFPTSETEDALFLWFGDSNAHLFTEAVQKSPLGPVAFAFVPVGNRASYGVYGSWGECVEKTAQQLGIPCFEVDEETFADPYALPRVFRNLIAATPVGETVAKPTRTPLAEVILNTPVLEKPAWAA